MLVQNHLSHPITCSLSLFWLCFNIDSTCGDGVKCAAKAALGLKCSVSSLAAPVSLRQSTNAETDTSLGGACSYLTMCHPKTGFTKWVKHGPERDTGHPGPLWAYCHRKLANRTNCWMQVAKTQKWVLSANLFIYNSNVEKANWVWLLVIGLKYNNSYAPRLCATTNPPHKTSTWGFTAQ